MVIKKYVRYDFRVEYKEGKDICTINLDEQVLSRYKISSETKQLERQYSLPIRVDKELGLVVWLTKDEAWIPVNDEIKRAYSDYLAEKALLGGNDGSTKNGNNKEESTS